MTLTIHWWVIPLGVTIIAWIWALLPGEPDGGYLQISRQVATIPAALIISLIAWLIGALCR